MSGWKPSWADPEDDEQASSWKPSWADKDEPEAPRLTEVDPGRWDSTGRQYWGVPGADQDKKTNATITDRPNGTRIAPTYAAAADVVAPMPTQDEELAGSILAPAEPGTSAGRVTPTNTLRADLLARKRALGKGRTLASLSSAEIARTAAVRETEPALPALAGEEMLEPSSAGGFTRAITEPFRKAAGGLARLGAEAAEATPGAESALTAASYLGKPFTEARAHLSVLSPVGETEEPETFKSLHELLKIGTDPIRSNMNPYEGEDMASKAVMAPLRLGGEAFRMMALDPINAAMMFTGAGETPAVIEALTAGLKGAKGLKGAAGLKEALDVGRAALASKETSALTKGLASGLGKAFVPVMGEGAIQGAGEMGRQYEEKGASSLMDTIPNVATSLAFAGMGAKHQAQAHRVKSEHKQNVAAYESAGAKAAHNETVAAKTAQLADLDVKLKEAVDTAGATKSPEAQARAVEIKQQRDAVNEELNGGAPVMGSPEVAPLVTQKLTQKEDYWRLRREANEPPRLGERLGGERLGRSSESEERRQRTDPDAFTSPRSAGAGMSADQVADQMNSWADGPAATGQDVRVYESVTDPGFLDALAQDAAGRKTRERVEESLAAGVPPEYVSRTLPVPGFATPDGVMHILAPRVESPMHLAELMGHEGVHSAVAEARRTGQTHLVFGRSGEERALKALAARRIDPSGPGRRVQQHYSGEEMRVIGEEVLAHGKEFVGTRMAPDAMDRAVTWVREGLRGALPERFQKIVERASDSEIRVMLDRAGKLVAKGSGKVEKAPSLKPAPLKTEKVLDPERKLTLDDINLKDGPTDLDDLGLILVNAADAATYAQEKAARTEAIRLEGERTAPLPRPSVDVDAMAAEQAANETAAAEAARARDAETGPAVLDQAAAEYREPTPQEKLEQEAADTRAARENQPVEAAGFHQPAPREAKPKLAPTLKAPPVDPRGRAVLGSILDGQPPADNLRYGPDGRPVEAPPAKPPTSAPQPAVPLGKAPKKGGKTRKSIRSLLGEDTRERDNWAMPLMDEQRKAREDKSYWARYAVPDRETATYSGEAAQRAAFKTLTRAGITGGKPIPGVKPGEVHSVDLPQGGTLLVSTWKNGERAGLPAYAWGIGPSGDIAWAHRFGMKPGAVEGTREASRPTLDGLLTKTDPEHPFRVMQGELAKRYIQRDPTTDALSKGGVDVAELLAPTDTMVDQFQAWAEDPGQLVGKVRFEDGEHAPLTLQQISNGLEELRLGLFGGREAHAVSMHALDIERSGLAVDSGVKIKTSEDVYGTARSEQRPVLGEPGRASAPPAGLGRGGVPGGEQEVAGAREGVPEADGRGGLGSGAVRRSDDLAESPFPEAETELDRPAVKLSRRQEETPEFKEWFGKSKVVGKDGKPLVVYHGTDRFYDFAEFKGIPDGSSQLGFGIHFGEDPVFVSDNYAGKTTNGTRVYPVYLDVKNPLDATAIVKEGSREFALARKLAGSKLLAAQDESGSRTAFLQRAIDATSPSRAEKLIREAGYDGVKYEIEMAERTPYGWRTNERSPGWVVFSPTQIKSATGNDGTFSRTDPDIRRSVRDDEGRKHGIGAERGERVVGRSSLIPGDLDKVDTFVNARQFGEAKGPYSVTREEMRADLADQIRSTRARFPRADGWAPLELVGIGTDKKTGKPFVKWSPIGYGFAARPGVGKAPVKMDAAWARKLADRALEDIGTVYDRARSGDEVAKNIIAQHRWYRDMQSRLRSEFGGAGDLFADLLGAFSPNTPVATNWDFAVKAIKGFSRGEYRRELQSFSDWVDAGKPLDKFPRADKIRQRAKEFEEQGKLFGMNSNNGMLAFLNMWRATQPGQAPKARNFARNLIGASDMATIDVWAARYLRRMADGVSNGRYPRVPTPAEGGVSGTWNAKATAVTGEFGLGANVLEQVAAGLRKKGIDITAPDVQAVMWFMEKEHWTKNDWTAGLGEGGSFDAEAQKADLDRFLAGVTPAQGSDPGDKAMRQTGLRLLAATRGDDNVVAARALPTLGMYAGSGERALDAEVTARSSWDPSRWVSTVAEIAKRHSQTDAFVSRVVRDTEHNMNARPGIEVFFREALTQADVSRIEAVLERHGEPGYTLTVDPREARTNKGEEPGEYTGLRIQYVPEIALRYGDTAITEAVKAGPDAVARVLSEKATNLNRMVDELAVDKAVAFADLFLYDTVAFGKENYDAYTDRVRPGAAPAGGGRAWFGQPIHGALEKAARRYGIERGEERAGGLLQREGPFRRSIRDDADWRAELAPRQVDVRVARLDLAEEDLAREKPGHEIKGLMRDKPQPWDARLDDAVDKLDLTTDDDQWARLASRKGRVLDVTEQQALAKRVQKRWEESDAAMAKRDEAAALSPAEQKARGIDMQAVVKDEIAARLAYVAMEFASVNAGTQAGRALAARRRVMAAGTDITPDAMLRRIIKELPDVDKDMATDLYGIYHNSPKEFTNALRLAMKPGKLKKAMEYWKAGLLSGLGTHGANIIGNAVEPAAMLAETLVAAGIDKAMSKHFGTERTRFAGEFKHELAGQLRAVPAALSKLADEFKAQILRQEEPDISAAGPLEYQVGAIGPGWAAIPFDVGKAVRTPFRALTIADRFFKAIGYEAELHKLAYREARKEGFTGEKADARAAAIVDSARENMGQRWRELVEKADEGMKQRVYQGEPVKIIRSLMTLTRDHPAAGFAMPFLRTPAEITRRGWQRSPMGFVPGGRATKTIGEFNRQRAGLRPQGGEVGQGEVSDAIARPLVGLALTTAFSGLAAMGMLTGGGPVDKEEKKLKRATGWQPYSLVLPGPNGKKLYIPYARFEPISSLLGIVGDAFEVGDERKVGDKILGSITQNYLSKQWWKGLNDFASALVSPDRSAKTVLAPIAGSFAVPAIAAKTAEAIDPVFRERRSDPGLTGLPESSARSIARRIPGVSRGEEPIYDPLGAPEERPGNALTRFALPVQPSLGKAGKELEEYLVKIHEAPSPIPDAAVIPKSLFPPNSEFDPTGTRIVLLDSERALLAKSRLAAATTLRQNLSKLKAMPLDDQRDLIQKIFRGAQAEALEKMWATSPALRERARQKVAR